ncbi:hypothetical protein FHR92_001051 [Fontibacillus solani]|uniref:Uncharacterized protein n=1 Tax=Fontibacillus solani TaxID=1572857 RepID=A0A7W3SR74_9BACL|nr:hypothetical protein [Fontibacillus solani]MBA9084594.1 hypothetical protein [Fontibacillus solani]
MDNITIWDVLRSLTSRRKLYVKWRFDLWRAKDEVPADEQELIERMHVKSLLPYQEWERTDEFRHISSLVLQSNQGRDLEELYNKVKERALNEPNAKDIEIMLKLQKEIGEHYKDAQRYFKGEE